MSEFLSLYDFLGKPAGNELGKLVFKEAIRKNAQYRYRKISNPKYVGNVTLYQREFLEDYFYPKEEMHEKVLEKEELLLEFNKCLEEINSLKKMLENSNEDPFPF